MPMWNPWRGCRKCSEGCRYCYIHKGDARRGVDTSQIVRTSDFDKPVRQLKKGGYKMKPGLVYLGFSTDFLIEEADPWRADCWKMIRERQDCTFLFLTKRIERFSQCIRKNVSFEFRQCGTHFIKDGRRYTLQTRDLCRQARLAGIHYTRKLP